MSLADLRAALIIAARIVRQRVRDRSAIVFAVLTPLGLALAFATLIPNDFTAFHTHFVVVDEDHGPTARLVVEQGFAGVARSGIADVSEESSETRAIDILKAGNAGAVVVIPNGFTAAINSGQPTQIRVLGGQFPISLEVARSVVSRFASDIGAVQLMVETSAAAGGTRDQATLERAIAAAQQPGPIEIVADQVARRQAGLATFYGAAMAIMFIFFATQYGALAINSDRENGTLARLLAAPIKPSAILLGSSLAGLVLGLISMSVLIVATTVVGGASWGSPVLVALLVLAAVVAATGMTALVATLARSAQAAGTLNAIVAIGLSAIGGVFIPLAQMPSNLASLSLITPHSWFLRGIDTLSDPSAGLVDILPSLAVLALIGLVLGTIGLVRARRTLELA